MSRINYNAMSNSELKEYFLKHPGDRESLQVYLDRINQNPPHIIASPQDPDFEQKIQEAIRQKLAESKKITYEKYYQTNVSINQE
jgi:hypothetical protein